MKKELEKLWRFGSFCAIALGASILTLAVVFIQIEETPIEGSALGQLLFLAPFYTMLLAFCGVLAPFLGTVILRLKQRSISQST